MARVVVVGGGFGGLAAAARLAKLGHDGDPGRAVGASWAARCPLVSDGRLHLGRRADVDAAARRDPRPVPQVRSSGRAGAGAGAAGPWSASTGSRTARRSGCPAARGPAQVAAFDGLGPGLGQQLGRPRGDSYADDWEVLRRGYLEVPWDPDAAPPRAGRAAGQPRGALQAAEEDFKDERLRLVAGTPLRRRGARPAQRARPGSG